MMTLAILGFSFLAPMVSFLFAVCLAFVGFQAGTYVAESTPNETAEWIEALETDLSWEVTISEAMLSQGETIAVSKSLRSDRTAVECAVTSDLVSVTSVDELFTTEEETRKASNVAKIIAITARVKAARALTTNLNEVTTMNEKRTYLEHLAYVEACEAIAESLRGAFDYSEESEPVTERAPIVKVAS